VIFRGCLKLNNSKNVKLAFQCGTPLNDDDDDDDDGYDDDDDEYTLKRIQLKSWD
jgi:hypothetical protein